MKAEDLELPLMITQKENEEKTSMESIVLALASKESKPELNRPGHIFPLKYREGIAGHTEASVDLAVLAGLEPAAVLSLRVLLHVMARSLELFSSRLLIRLWNMQGEIGDGQDILVRVHWHKARAYNPQDDGHDTVEAESDEELGLPFGSREYGFHLQFVFHHSYLLYSKVLLSKSIR
ncbi:hypothetical protein V6N12_038246 [Hibiscus sabdariffa]|uniref:3,4-dihydroxy-2-butanone-4-phosphate synthase n=1 Tax=Hibiscus sabdariffa TaxID=183260 RepID=A0ABR2BYG5_9ROSI